MQPIHARRQTQHFFGACHSASKKGSGKCRFRKKNFLSRFRTNRPIDLRKMSFSKKKNFSFPIPNKTNIDIFQRKPSCLFCGSNPPPVRPDGKSHAQRRRLDVLEGKGFGGTTVPPGWERRMFFRGTGSGSPWSWSASTWSSTPGRRRARSAPRLGKGQGAMPVLRRLRQTHAPRLSRHRGSLHERERHRGYLPLSRRARRPRQRERSFGPSKSTMPLLQQGRETPHFSVVPRGGTIILSRSKAKNTAAACSRASVLVLSTIDAKTFSSTMAWNKDRLQSLKRVDMRLVEQITLPPPPSNDSPVTSASRGSPRDATHAYRSA